MHLLPPINLVLRVCSRTLTGLCCVRLPPRPGSVTSIAKANSAAINDAANASATAVSAAIAQVGAVVSMQLLGAVSRRLHGKE